MAAAQQRQVGRRDAIWPLIQPGSAAAQAVATQLGHAEATLCFHATAPRRVAAESVRGLVDPARPRRSTPTKGFTGHDSSQARRGEEKIARLPFPTAGLGSCKLRQAEKGGGPLLHGEVPHGRAEAKLDPEACRFSPSAPDPGKDCTASARLH